MNNIAHCKQHVIICCTTPNFLEWLHRIVLETEGREIAEKVSGHGLEGASSAEQVGCRLHLLQFWTEETGVFKLTSFRYLRADSSQCPNASKRAFGEVSSHVMLCFIFWGDNGYLLLCLDNTFFLLAMEKEKYLESMNVWNGMVFPKFSCSFCKP